MKGKTLGSALMVVGTTVGAGMLSLPLVTAACGFMTTLVLLLASWSVMYLTSLKLLTICAEYPAGVNFSTIIKDRFSKPLQVAFTICYLLLLFSLMAAYTTQGSSFVSSISTQHINTPLLNSLIFLAVFGAIILSIKLTDYVNRVFICLKFAFFFLCVIAMLPFLAGHHLSASSLSFAALIFAWPTLLPSFGFQNIIPVLYEYQQRDTQAIKKSIFIGSMIVLAIYVIWVICCLSILPQTGSNSYQSIFQQGNTLNALITAISQHHKNHTIKLTLNIFINVSIVTSFVCTGISLLHVVRDIFRRCNINLHLLGCLVISLAPPLLFTLLYPQGFILALQYASILAVFIFVYTPVTLQKQVLSAKSIYTLMLGTAVIIAQLYNLIQHPTPF